MRSPRLIKEEIEKRLKELTDFRIKEAEDRLRELEIKKGDIQTGFEIIAGLPLKEQTKINSGLDMRKGVGTATGVNLKYIELQTLYKWNGEEWEINETTTNTTT